MRMPFYLGVVTLVTACNPAPSRPPPTTGGGTPPSESPGRPPAPAAESSIMAGDQQGARSVTVVGDHVYWLAQDKENIPFGSLVMRQLKSEPRPSVVAR